MRRHLQLVLAVLGALALVAPGCGADDAPSQAGASTPTADLSGEILVSAAASLTDALTELGEDLETDHPDVTVTFTFDSSGTLADQVLAGAPVDVFASADEATMTELTDAGLVAGKPVAFAANHLVIVTKAGNPEGIQALDDLVDVGVVALCGEGAPCGRFAEEVLDGAGVEIPEERVTRGQNVRATLTAVAEGDAVAGIVYLTDAAAAGDAVGTVEIPEEQNTTAVYPIGVLEGAGHPEVAQAFVELVTSEDGLEVLERHGFLAPR